MTYKPVEPEVAAASRDWTTSQQLLDGVALHSVPNLSRVGWHDTIAHPYRGAFAVVRRGSDAAAEERLALIGEVLIITRGQRRALVYCMNSANVPTDLSLSRNAFFRLGLPAHEWIECTVEVRA